MKLKRKEPENPFYSIRLNDLKDMFTYFNTEAVKLGKPFTPTKKKIDDLIQILTSKISKQRKG